jgi:HK97 family phage prohead protease
MANKTKHQPVPEFETRISQGVKFRMESREGKTVATGYAATFNSFSADLGGFREKIAPGAFEKVLSSNPDTRALVNHNPDLILGRTTAGTLRLSEDAHGLRVEMDLPDGITYADDLKISMERGDISQMSFSFRIAPGGDKGNAAIRVRSAR